MEALKQHLTTWIESVARTAAESTGAGAEPMIKVQIASAVKKQLLPKILLAGGLAVGSLALGITAQVLMRKR